MEPVKLPSLISLARDRPVKLAGAVALTLATVALVDGLADTAALGWLGDLISKSDVFGPLFFPDSGTIEWKDRLQGIVLLLGLPVAFLLWYWRDRNVRDQIEEQRRQVENARKDTNLKEFLDVRLHAAGAIDPALPAEARQQLQIAALHQLRGFLRGEYGESFRRPAFELLLAGHAAAMDEIGTESVRGQLCNIESINIESELKQAISELRTKLTPVMLERMGIIRDEVSTIFDSGFPLNGRNFDLLTLGIPFIVSMSSLEGSSFLGADLRKSCLKFANLEASHLEGANLADSDLEAANLSSSHLTGIDMPQSNLERCNLMFAHLEGAYLIGCNFKNADLNDTALSSADFSGSNLEGATIYGSYLYETKLSQTNLKGADLSRCNWQDILNAFDATFDDSTEFWGEGGGRSEKDMALLHDQFRKLGARHVNDPLDGGGQDTFL